MLIKTICGSNIDIDKLDDIDAILYKNANKFFKFCEKNKIAFILRFVKKTGIKVESGGTSNCNDNKEDFEYIIKSLNVWLESTGYKIVKY